MMKFLLMIIFMIPLCFLKKKIWMVQMMMMLLMMMFMFMNINIMNYCNLTYMLGCDLISFGLIMLSIWICMLMVMASEGLYNNNFFEFFFY